METSDISVSCCVDGGVCKLVTDLLVVVWMEVNSLTEHLFVGDDCSFILLLEINSRYFFQETSVLAIHLLGAVMAFGLGTVYAWIQTTISYQMCPHSTPYWLCHLRTVLCAISSITFIASILANITSQFHGNENIILQLVHQQFLEENT